MEIEELQERVDAWIRTYGVRYFSELTNMACLTEEVGELARVMARTYGDQSFKAGEKKNLADEMADVLWVLVCLANQTGVDLRPPWRPTSPRRPPAIGSATSTTRSSGTEPSGGSAPERRKKAPCRRAPKRPTRGSPMVRARRMTPHPGDRGEPPHRMAASAGQVRFPSGRSR